MKDSFIQEQFADRIGGNKFGKGTVLYKFEKIKRAKREALEVHPGMEVIDMGVGEPDAMADMEVVRVLAKEAAIWENRGYTDNGRTPFMEEAARYLETVYQVPGIDPQTEVMHSIGSKPALAMLPQAFINPGDITLMTVPGYPVIGTITEWLGGESYPLPLSEKNGYLPELTKIPEDVAKRAKLLYINYPNNPTGATATEEFFKDVVAFAKKHEIIVVQDAAYAALTFDGAKPLSFLRIPGAKDVGIEIHSLSKAFNMTGWRMAFVAGNPLLVKAFGAVKDNYDSGQFHAIQLAAKYALMHPEITERTAEKYGRRHDMLLAVLQKHGFRAKKPKASFYQYVHTPKGVKNGVEFASGEDFSQWLLREKLISTVPWDDVEPAVRFSVTFIAEGEAEEKRVMDEIDRRLSDTEFIF